MTKYILHGGCTQTPCRNNDNFFQEILKSLPEPVNILCVYFASHKIWDEKFREDQKRFINNSNQKNLLFVMADQDNDKFTNQINQADVFYLQGGRNENLLIKKLKEINNLKELLQGKVVIGSSAGAMALCKYSASSDLETIVDGLGILPIKTFVHYPSELTEKMNRLKNHGEDLEIIKLPETEYVIIEK